MIPYRNDWEKSIEDDRPKQTRTGLSVSPGSGRRCDKRLNGRPSQSLGAEVHIRSFNEWPASLQARNWSLQCVHKKRIFYSEVFFCGHLVDIQHKTQTMLEWTQNPKKEDQYWRDNGVYRRTIWRGWRGWLGWLGWQSWRGGGASGRQSVRASGRQSVRASGWQGVSAIFSK